MNGPEERKEAPDVSATTEGPSAVPDGPDGKAATGEGEAGAHDQGHHHHHRRRVKELEEELRKAKEEYDRLLDTARRIKAEYENYRKRTESQFLERVESEKAALLMGYLAVLDDVERAWTHLTDTASLEEWRKGMELVLGRFRRLLEEHGLEAVDPTGRPFDPSCHEALVMTESPDVAEETVVEVFQKGYRMNGRLIRHAKVKVAKPAGSAGAESAAGNEPQTPEGGTP